jgi:hypothetical protein
VIGGSEAKLWSGGGEVVAHSRVWPPHGSSPAGLPSDSDVTKFQTKMTTAIPMTRLPNVETRFRSVQPVEGS